MSTEIIYVSELTHNEKKEAEFYIDNKQNRQLTRVRDPKQIELFNYCYYGKRVRRADIDQLINSGYQYFDSVDENVAWQKKPYQEL